MAAINNTVYSEYSDLNETKRAIEIVSKAGCINKNISSMGYNDIDDFLSKVYINKYYNEIKKKLTKIPTGFRLLSMKHQVWIYSGKFLNLAMYSAEQRDT